MNRAAAGALVIFAARTAAAAPPCVSVDPQSDVLDAAARSRIVEQLGAALAQHRIAVCHEGDEAPIASVVLAPSGKKRVAIRIDVRDAVTQKEIAREVDLSGLAPDGRALAVAVAADELLRASWAEIALAPPPAPIPLPPPVEPALPPPPEVRDVVAASMAPAESARRVMIGALVAGDHSSGGLDQLGFDGRVAFWIVPRVAATGRFGVRLSARQQATDGEAESSAMLAGLGVIVALTPRDRALAIEALARVDAERVQFLARPGADARGSNADGVAWTAAGGIGAALRLAPAWAITSEVTAGAALKPLLASDGGRSFTGIDGFQGGVALGVRASL